MRLPVFVAMLAILLLVIPSSNAALTQWDVLISLNDDKTSDWAINLVYDEAITKTDYFILPDIVDYAVTGDGVPLKCTLSTGPGALIICDNIRAKNIVYSIKTKPVVSDILQRFMLFTQKLSVTQPTQSFSVTIKLPLGAGLAEANRLSGTTLKPFEPENGRQGSDGRQIFVAWNLKNPVIGDTLYATVVYEQFSDDIQFTLFGIIIVVAIVAFFAFVFFTRHRPVQDVMPVLTYNEKKVVEILLREKKEVDQRAIVKETDFSKAKASRVISDLVKRGVIEKVSKGRKNIITLRKAIKAEKNAESKEPKKND